MLHYRVMKTSFVLIAALVLAVALAGGGYAAGRFFAPRTYTAAVTERTVYADDGDDADLAALQAENAALKARLEGLGKELAALRAQAEAEPEPAPAAEEPPRRMTRQERMEQLKRENPERYAEMERRRQEFQANMEAFQLRREDFFANLDLGLMTPEQQEMHFQYTEALAQQQAAIDRMRALAESGEEATAEDRAAIRESFRLVRGLQGAERDALLSAVAVSMGLQSGEETEAFVNVVKEVYDFTGMMPPAPMAPANGGNARPQPPPAP